MKAYFLTTSKGLFTWKETQKKMETLVVFCHFFTQWA